MDIKLKKSKGYSKNLKAFSVMCILGCFVGFFFMGMSLFGIRYERGMSPLVYSDYFDTEAFHNQYSQLVRDVVNVNLVYKDEENIKAGNALDKEIVLQRFAEERGLNPDIMLDVAGVEKSPPSLVSDIQGHNIMDSYNYEYENPWSYKVTQSQSATSVIVQEEVNDYDSSRNSYQECVDAYENDYPIYERRVIQGQLNDYKASRAEISNYHNFVYYLYNENEKNVYTNASLEIIQGLSVKSSIEGPYIDGYDISSNNFYIYYDDRGNIADSYYYDNYQDSIETILRDNGFFMSMGILQPMSPGDNLYHQFQNFNLGKSYVPQTVAGAVVLLAIIILLMIYLLMSAGQSEKGGEVTLIAIDKIFNDVQTVFVIICSVGSILLAMLIGTALYEHLGEKSSWEYVLQGFLLLLILADVMIALSYLLSMARQIKAKQIFRNTMVSAIIRTLGSLFSSKTFNGWLIFCMFMYAGVNIILFMMVLASNDLFSFMLMVSAVLVFNIICAGLFLRALSSLAKIMVAVKETSKGNLCYELNINEISPSFINFATDVAGMQIGLKKAVEEAVKGERMKTDLITNVSHDLKTPLTSIITYVDLLKKEEVGNDVAEGYINVLVDKSYRLKQLIEDLIEASKASSGNLTVTVEKVDLRQLIMQASGEFEEKIEAARLNFRVSSTGETFIRADGKLMWRIAENLISNAIKYSMPNSRVYIDIIKTKTTGTLVIKNISEQPIEVVPDQLTERFVRGDVSRTTEGSGLGLSIAKSLTALQGGAMEINIDGDLFKVSIKMPLWEEIVTKNEKSDGNKNDQPKKDIKLKEKLLQKQQMNSDKESGIHQAIQKLRKSKVEE